MLHGASDVLQIDSGALRFLALAIHAERVVIEVNKSSLLPLVVVATLTGRGLAGTP